MYVEQVCTRCSVRNAESTLNCLSTLLINFGSGSVGWLKSETHPLLSFVGLIHLYGMELIGLYFLQLAAMGELDFFFAITSAGSVNAGLINTRVYRCARDAQIVRY